VEVELFSAGLGSDAMFRTAFFGPDGCTPGNAIHPQAHINRKGRG